EKGQTLLRTIGLEDKVAELERQEQELYNERLAIGRIADQKKKFADEQPYYPDAPKELVSAADLIKQQQEILARNGENQRKRERVDEIKRDLIHQQDKVFDLRRQLKEAEEKLQDLTHAFEIAQKSAQDLHDESTAEIEQSIANIEEINRRVRANFDKEKAEEDAREYARQYDQLTEKIEAVQKAKIDLLNGA